MEQIVSYKEILGFDPAHLPVVDAFVKLYVESEDRSLLNDLIKTMLEEDAKSVERR